MAQVELEINGRVYTVGCGDGEEPRLTALAKYVDAKLRELAVRVGPLGEARLLMLTCLTLADELGEALQRAEVGRRAREEMAATGPDTDALKARIAELEARLGTREDEISRDLARIADRLTAAADRLAPAG
jgi:cell division protein ZapA